MFQQIRTISLKWKIIRGMLSYGTIWPCASIIEQTLVEKKSLKTYDWMKCLRFSLFGAFFMGPTLYVWFRLAEVMWPKRSLKSTICKICTESVSYDPMSISTFLFAMTLMEGKSYEEAKHEVKTKFFETYKVGLISWPFIQIVNFTFVPIRNQVVFVSCFSMIWTSFLAYRIHLEKTNIEEIKKK